MYLAKVIKRVTSSQKHEAYVGKKVYIVQQIKPDGEFTGEENIAIDYVGSGIGDVVICGGAPGVAKVVFDIELAPMRTLIMAIVDKINYTNL